MGSFSLNYTFTGVEPKPGLISSFYPIQNWAGSFTITFSASTIPTSDIFNLDYRLVRSSDGFVCFSDSTTIFTGSNPYVATWTVGVPSGSWHALNWDTFELRYGTASDRVPAGIVYTMVFNGAGIGPPPTPCQYGSEANDPLKSILEMSPDVAGLFLPAAASPWAIPIVLATMGAYVAVNTLCGSNPPAPQVINESDWTTIDNTLHTSVAVRKVAQNFQNELWQHLCH